MSINIYKVTKVYDKNITDEQKKQSDTPYHVRYSQIDTRAFILVAFNKATKSYNIEIHFDGSRVNHDIFIKATDINKHVSYYFKNFGPGFLKRKYEHFDNLQTKEATQRANKTPMCFIAKWQSYNDETPSYYNSFVFYDHKAKKLSELAIGTVQTKYFKNNIKEHSVYFKITKPSYRSGFCLDKNYMTYNLYKIKGQYGSLYFNNTVPKDKICNEPYISVCAKINIKQNSPARFFDNLFTPPITLK